MANLVSFNVGVEIGQVIALAIVVALIAAWRRTRGFAASAVAVNWLLLVAGFCLIGFQLAGYLFAKGA